MSTLFIVSGNGLKSEFWESHLAQTEVDKICLFSSIDLCAKNLHQDPIAIIIDDYFSAVKHPPEKLEFLWEQAQKPVFHLSPMHAMSIRSTTSEIIYKNFSTELVDDINALVAGDEQVA